jgi:hypothetical protein
MNKVSFYDPAKAENYQRELRRRGYTTSKETDKNGKVWVMFTPKVGQPVPQPMLRAKNAA